LAYFRPAKRKSRSHDQKLVMTSLILFQAKWRYQIEIKTDFWDEFLVLRTPKYNTCCALEVQLKATISFGTEKNHRHNK
jgi:hypothetical protein